MSRPSRLDKETLSSLRTVLQNAQPLPGDGLPLDQVVALGNATRDGARVTIDFDAAATLGQPLLVLHRDPGPQFEGISRREREVIELIGTGMSNKQIASELCVALSTVKDHVHNILTKTGLPNRTAIVVRFKPSP